MDDQTNKTNVQPKPLQEDWLPGATVGNATPPKPKRRGAVIALIIVVVAGIIAGAAYVLWPKSCFEPENYQGLVAAAQNFEGGDGIDVTGVTMNEDLFAQSIYFKDGTSEINTEISDDTSDFFTMLGTYYAAHQADAPIAIVLETNYLAGSPVSVAQQRLVYVKDSLVKAGISESSITIRQPLIVEMDADDEGMYDDDIVDGMPVAVRVVPVSRCEQ